MWPVVHRPAHGVVATGGWRGEVENVALGDAKMFEKLPARVREVGWNGAPVGGRKVRDDIFEGGVGLTTVQKIDQLSA